MAKQESEGGKISIILLPTKHSTDNSNIMVIFCQLFAIRMSTNCPHVLVRKKKTRLFEKITLK